MDSNGNFMQICLIKNCAKCEAITNVYGQSVPISAEDLARFHNNNDGGTKHDQDKTPLSLLSSQWLFGVGEVLKFGAKKYAAHNWRKGIKISRLMDAALRHQLAFIGGEDNDSETGLPHLHHASCCLMFASELMKTMPEMDDRFKSGK